MKRAQEVNKSSEDNETSLDEISEDHETSVDKNTEDHKIQTNEGQEVKVDEDKDADITETQFTENDSKMESLDLSRDLDGNRKLLRCDFLYLPLLFTQNVNNPL